MKVVRTKFREVNVEPLRGPTKVEVGFPMGNPAVDKAIYTNYGTRGSGKRFGTARGGGFGGPVPPRPFMNNAIEDNRAEVKMLLTEQAEALIYGETTLQEIMTNLGHEAVNWIRDAIDAMNSPPNSPTTIRIKGSSKPLIDSGRMRGAATFEVRD